MRILKIARGEETKDYRYRACVLVFILFQSFRIEKLRWGRGGGGKATFKVT